MALAPPPGTTLRSRCFKISTGASRETREISPNTNSSATRSARTVTVSLGKDSTIFRRRSFSLICFVINMLGHNILAPRVQPKIFSRAGLPFRDSRQNGSRQDGIHNVSGMVERKVERSDRERLELFLQRPQIDRIFFRGQEATGAEPVAHGQQALDVPSVIGMVVAELDFCGTRDSGGTNLREELLWPRDRSEEHRCDERSGHDDFSLHSPD